MTDAYSSITPIGIQRGDIAIFTAEKAMEIGTILAIRLCGQEDNRRLTLGVLEEISIESAKLTVPCSRSEVKSVTIPCSSSQTFFGFGGKIVLTELQKRRYAIL